MVIYPAGIAQAELLPMLTDVAGIALSGTPYKQAEMDASPAMEVVARIGVGYDAVEVPALTARRVPLMVAGTANSTSVAEHAFHLMMALAKRTPALDALVRKGTWADRHGGLPMELSGKTVLIVGFGRIGTRSARRCQGFDMNVLIYDPYVPAEKITGGRLRARHRPGRRAAARGFRVDPLPEEPRDGGHVQRRAAGAHEARCVHRQHGARRHHRRAGAARRADVGRIWRARGSMCSTWSRRRSTTRCCNWTR